MKQGEMNEYNTKGYELSKKAESKLEGGFFKNMMTSKEERFDKALDCYKQALDNFKLAKNCYLIRGRMRSSQS